MLQLLELPSTHQMSILEARVSRSFDFKKSYLRLYENVFQTLRLSPGCTVCNYAVSRQSSSYPEFNQK